MKRALLYLAAAAQEEPRVFAWLVIDTLFTAALVLFVVNL